MPLKKHEMAHIGNLKTFFSQKAREVARKTKFASVQEGRVFRQKAKKLVDGLDRSIPHIYLPATWETHESPRYKAFLQADENITLLASEHLLLEWAAKIHAMEKRLHNARSTASRHHSHGHPGVAAVLSAQAQIIEEALRENRQTFEKVVFFHYGEKLGSPANHSIEPDLGAHNAAKWLHDHHEILLAMFPRK